MSKKTIVLYGGSGYLGHYIAKEAISRGYPVVSLNRHRINTVDGVVNICTRGPKGFHKARSFIESLDARFIHLACPRNKKGAWNLVAAVSALDKGLRLGECCSGGVFVSSMSVLDTPTNEYATFKHTAEVAASLAGLEVMRLGTVLGAEQGGVFRHDLGLHRIAENEAFSLAWWVNPSVRRYITPIKQAYRQILEMSLSERGRVSNMRVPVHMGAMKYEDIVAGQYKTAPRKNTETYSCPDYAPASDDHEQRVIRGAFRSLVHLISCQEVTGI